MLIARENYACLHISRDHERYAYDEYMIISGMLITRVNCIRWVVACSDIYPIALIDH